MLIRLLANGFEQSSNQKLTIKMEGIIMVKRSFMVSLLLFASSSAFSCYDPAGSGQCGPNGIGPRNPSAYSGGGVVYNPPSPPPPPRIVKLPDRFGAVAVNQTTFASTYNMSSKKEARQKALRECQYGQKQPCVIYSEYANGCISLVNGWNDKDARGNFFASVSATRGQAYYDVMNKCSAKYSNCQVVIQEECSIAEPPR